MISQSTGNLVFNEKGRVIRGRWISAYSGKVLVDASKVDIDHVVPLHWAWEHGAAKWSQDEREMFANDQRNLLAVEASLNRQKGDKGINEWLPPQNQDQYKARFLRIVKLYDLN
ncbi:HNH endonuclease family protein [Vibrio sp. RC27]